MRVFVREEEGAATVDFVVLAAAAIVMSVTLMTVISSGTTDVAEDISDTMADTEVSTGL